MPRSGKKKKNTRAIDVDAGDDWTGESRVAVFLTVGWLFTGLTTLLAMIGWIAAMVYVSRQVDADERFDVLMFYLTLVMLVCGACTLILGWAARRTRIKQAPHVVRRVLGVVAALPWAIVVVRMLGR